MLDSFATHIGRAYPFVSGQGTFSNTAIFRYLHPKDAEDEWVRVAGREAFIPGGDYVGRAMKYVGDLDGKVTSVINRVIEPGQYCLDVGGNLGLVTLNMVRRVGTTGQVHTFEPSPILLPYLKATFDRLKSPNVVLHEFALGDVPGEVPFFTHPTNLGRCGLREDDDGEGCRVEVRTLDDFWITEQKPKIDFIKIDVEGFEAQVLKGAEVLLRTDPPPVILFEEHETISEQMQWPPSMALLRDAGYSIFAMPRTLWRLKLLPAAPRVRAHDYVAISARANDRVWRKLDIAQYR